MRAARQDLPQEMARSQGCGELAVGSGACVGGGCADAVCGVWIHGYRAGGADAKDHDIAMQRWRTWRVDWGRGVGTRGRTQAAG